MIDLEVIKDLLKIWQRVYHVEETQFSTQPTKTASALWTKRWLRLFLWMKLSCQLSFAPLAIPLHMLVLITVPSTHVMCVLLRVKSILRQPYLGLALAWPPSIRVHMTFVSSILMCRLSPVVIPWKALGLSTMTMLRQVAAVLAKLLSSSQIPTTTCIMMLQLDVKCIETQRNARF